MMSSIFGYSLLILFLGFNVAGWIRVFAVPGTRVRYVMVTIQWALMPVALGLPAMMIVAGSRFSGSLSFLVMIWVVYDLYRDDDDNWFRRKRKQLKRYLANIRVRRLQPAGARV